MGAQGGQWGGGKGWGAGGEFQAPSCDKREQREYTKCKRWELHGGWQVVESKEIKMIGWSG